MHHEWELLMVYWKHAAMGNLKVRESVDLLEAELDEGLLVVDDSL